MYFSFLLQFSRNKQYFFIVTMRCWPSRSCLHYIKLHYITCGVGEIKTFTRKTKQEKNRSHKTLTSVVTINEGKKIKFSPMINIFSVTVNLATETHISINNNPSETRYSIKRLPESERTGMRPLIPVSYPLI